MLPTSTATSPGGVKLQKLKSSEDIHANSLFVIKRGTLLFKYYRGRVVSAEFDRFRWPKGVRDVR